MTKKLFFLFCLIPLLLIGVQARPIVEISVGDTWTYEGDDDFDYLVIDKQDFENGDEYVELIQVQTNERIEVNFPSVVNFTQAYSNLTHEYFIEVISFDADVIFTTEERWHTSRGNFIAIIEKTGTCNLTTTINDTVYQITDTVSFKNYYLDLDLQSPIVTGNPIYVERVSLWKLNSVNMTFYDTVTYRIDGTDEFTMDYKGTPTAVRNVTIDPIEREQTFLCSAYNFGGSLGNLSVVGFENYLWVFANDIGLPIYKEIGYVQPPLSLAFNAYDKTYNLASFNIALSEWVIEETSFNWISILSPISLLISIYVIINRRRR